MALLELDNLLRELLGSKRRARYGVSVMDAAPDHSAINAEFRFLAGHSYCCAEPDCHIPRSCERLVRLAAERSILIPDDVVLYWHCVVEKGARLQCHSAFGLPAESEGYEFDAVSGGKFAKSAPEVVEHKPPPQFTGLWTIVCNYGARIETEYVDGVPNGSYRYWHERGACLREGVMKNGQRNGEWITRSSDGTILDVSEYQEGTGIYRIFNSNGQLTDEIPMQHGKAHGAAKRWSLGKLVETRHYVDGQCVAANYEPHRRKGSTNR